MKAQKSAKGSKKSKKDSAPKSKLSALKNMLLGSGKKQSAKASKKPLAAKTPKGPKKPIKVASDKSPKKQQKVAEAPAAKSAKGPEKAQASGGKKSSTKSISARAYVSTEKKIDAHGQPICREVACEAMATTGDYCRLHYIKNWKKIKRKELILKEKKLNRYIEELVSKYPDKYIEVIRQDLSSDRDFSKVIHDLDLDESIEDIDSDMESIDSLIDSIRRDIDDEGEVY